MQLDACAYLHNYDHSDADPIFSPKFSSLLDQVPTYTAKQVNGLLG